MELTITNDENSFDPTPKLKSSPIPISFIYFDNRYECYCGSFYSNTILFCQKYCKNCLTKYIGQITDDNKYLDASIVRTKNVQCDKHEVARNIDFYTQNIKEWCESCSEIVCFNQIANIPNKNRYISEKLCKIFENEKCCKLCGKLVYKKISSGQNRNRLCSDCYKISSGWIESTFHKKLIPILYLPWWDSHNRCLNCNQVYESSNFISDCQKWCSYCNIIYSGCRYSLVTRISESNNIDKFIDTSVIMDIHNRIADYMKSIVKDSNPLDVYEAGLLPL